MAKNPELLSFFLWATENDRYHIPRLLQQIRDAGHSGEVIVISDGPLPESPSDCVVVQTSDRIKNQDIKAFVHRQFSLLIEHSKSEHFIQVDPDSDVWWLPPVPDAQWAGQIIRYQGITSTWGCGAYFSREVIEAIVNNPIQKEFSYHKGGCADLTIGKHLNSLVYFPVRWEHQGQRVCKLGMGIPSNLGYSRRWAITHPVNDNPNPYALSQIL